MKKVIFYLFLLVVGIVTGCSSALDNSFTIKSIAQETVFVNFLGRLITVKPNSTQIIQNISKGTYAFSTSYNVPSGVTSTSVEGDAEGTVELKEGTRIYLFFSSRIQQTQGSGGAGAQNSYILVASLSSSDKIVSSTGP
ncbi:MAG: hypothetical protein QXO70_02725 [Candidatus Pacearchaeota archaeon]